MPYRPGDVIDSKYEVIERLGAGGMGELYKSRHSYLDAIRAIKVVHPQISGNEDARSRFLREARAATKVQHPNVATLHDFSGLADGSHYMVWEFIDGENLAQRLRARGTLPPAEAVRVVTQALHGLEAIHRAGIIHRDISPENLMITRDGAIKIIDLGVAKLEDPSEVASTRTGIFVGKLRYASPEQLGFLPDDEKIDARTDLYSLGMVLFELLTGRPPYEAKSPHEYFLIHARDEQQKRSVELPLDMPGGPALRQVLDRALERDRNRRFASAAEFAAALEGVRLTDQRDLATMAVPLDGETTMRVPPAPAATTVRTPMPAPLPAAPSRSYLPLIAVLAISLTAIAAVIFWPRKKAAEPAAPVVTSTTTPAVTEPRPQVAEASVNVVSEPAITTTTVAPAPVVTQTVPLEKPKPREPEPVREPEPEPEPEPVKPTPAPVQSNVPVYVDGGEDESTNEQLIEQLRREAVGVRKIEVHAGAMQNELVRALKEEFPRLEIGNGASVVIRFDGTLERLGRGRKRRAATATITKNGRVIFRYELPSEVFRVGMHPPEAFVNVLSDAVEVN
jgi:eukaryotic-like serine/threonine-protein kinase